MKGDIIQTFIIMHNYETMLVIYISQFKHLWSKVKEIWK